MSCRRASGPRRVAWATGAAYVTRSLSMSRTSPNRTASESSAAAGDASRAPRRCPRRRPTRSPGRRAARRRAPRASPSRRASPSAFAARPAARAGREQRAPQDGRGRPPGRRQAHVPRRHRQAVGLAHRRAGDDLGGQREVERHPPDDPHLLGVLLAEVGALRADERRTGSRRRSRRRRSGPGRAAPSSGAAIAPDRHARVEARRIDLVDGRREDDVHAGRARRSRGRAPRCAGTA